MALAMDVQSSNPQRMENMRDQFRAQPLQGDSSSMNASIPEPAARRLFQQITQHAAFMVPKLPRKKPSNSPLFIEEAAQEAAEAFASMKGLLQNKGKVDSFNEGNSDGVPLPVAVPDMVTADPGSPSHDSAGYSYFETAPPSMVGSDPPRIQAFAKLEFDDGEFYMNTYAVELGRDLRSARLAYGRDNDDSQISEIRRRRRSDSGGDASQASARARREDARHIASSVISESGGIIGIPESPKKSRGRKQKSTASSSLQLSRKEFYPIPHTDYQSLAMASLEGGLNPFDANHPLPLPERCPLVPIHPPAVAEGVPAGHRSISRKHVRIAFNFEKRQFEIEILGRNGAFVNEQWFPKGDVRPLKSGYSIQIGGVGVKFTLPDHATGAGVTIDADPTSGGKMSFEFEDGMGDRHIMPDSDDFSSFDEAGESEDQDQDIEEDEDEAEDDEDGDNGDDEAELNESGIEVEEVQMEEDSVEEEPEEVKQPIRSKRVTKVMTKAKAKSKTKAKVTAKAKAKLSKKQELVAELKSVASPPILPRKGPGRPPKNGIMSKREQALLARQARDAAKAAALHASGPQTEKGNNTDAKHANVGDAAAQIPAQPPAKRKYTKRKSKDAQSGEPNGVRESTEQTDSIAAEQGFAKPPKEKKPPKPPRSPSPVLDRSKFSAEELAKPQQSYVVLIHEALSNSATGAMSLPQIYRAIERRYPFYKFCVTTTGWQSSVRHNLSQHAAFRKIERDGKGWMWGLVPEVSIEKEKKRRASPPPTPSQHYYQQGRMMSNPYPYHGMPVPSGQMPPYVPTPNGQFAPYMHPSYAMLPGYRHPVHPHPSVVQNGLPLPYVVARPDPSATYQSPYQSNPPAVAPSQPSPPMLSNANTAHYVPTQQQSPPPAFANSYTGNYAPSQPLAPAPAPLRPMNNPSHTTSHRSSPECNHTKNESNKGPSLESFDGSGRIDKLSPATLLIISEFRHGIISAMEDKQHGEALVSSAIARTLNPSLPSAISGEDDSVEKSIVQKLSHLLNNVSKKPSATQAGIPAIEVPSRYPHPSSNSSPHKAEQQTHSPQAHQTGDGGCPSLGGFSIPLPATTTLGLEAKPVDQSEITTAGSTVYSERLASKRKLDEEGPDGEAGPEPVAKKVDSKDR